jgi:hypothetical protein
VLEQLLTTPVLGALAYGSDALPQAVLEGLRRHGVLAAARA